MTMKKAMVKCAVAILAVALVISPSACKKAPEFEVISLVVTPSEALADEAVTVKVDVKNVGEAEGIYPVTLTVNGEAWETR